MEREMGAGDHDHERLNFLEIPPTPLPRRNRQILRNLTNLPKPTNPVGGVSTGIVEDNTQTISQSLPLFNDWMIAELGRVQRIHDWSDEKHDRIKLYLKQIEEFLDDSPKPSFIRFVQNLNKLVLDEKWYNPELKVRPQYCVKYGDNNNTLLKTFDKEAVLWHLIHIAYIYNFVDDDAIFKTKVSSTRSF
jgi:hypothetical protein